MAKAIYRRKSPFGLQFQRDRSPLWAKIVAGSNKKLRVYNSNHKQETEPTPNGKAIKNWKSAPSDILPPRRLHSLNLIKQGHLLVTKIEMPVNIEKISFKTYNKKTSINSGKEKSKSTPCCFNYSFRVISEVRYTEVSNLTDEKESCLIIFPRLNERKGEIIWFK